MVTNIYLHCDSVSELSVHCSCYWISSAFFILLVQVVAHVTEKDSLCSFVVARDNAIHSQRSEINMAKDDDRLEPPKVKQQRKPLLPHGWTVRVSKSYPDRVYYFNTLTGATSWELPGLVEPDTLQVCLSHCARLPSDVVTLLLRPL